MRQGEGRIAATGKDEMERCWQTLHEEGERLMDGLGLDEVVIIQDQHGLARELVQGVEQGSEHRLDRWRRRSVQQCQGSFACSWVEGVEGGEDIGPEAEWVVIAGIEGDPGQWPATVVDLGMPGMEQAGLAPASWSHEEGERAFDGFMHPLHKLWT